jgi:hypothetical protein
MRMMEPV